jgi:uncharacterized membrane protein YGL010W
MKSLVEHLSSYAAYHRDRRNIATHFVGIPMIVVSIDALLARPSPWVAVAVTLGALGFYVSLDRLYAVAMAAFLGASLALGMLIASQSTTGWLVGAVGLFAVGWVFQLVGHVYEGKKPAFLDDLFGILLGPLFVVAELGFALGLGKELNASIEARVGPTRIRVRGELTADR